MREKGVRHRQDAVAGLRETFDSYSREGLRATYLETETVNMRSGEDLEDFLGKRDRCRNHLNSVTPKEGPLNHKYENIILRRLSPEYDRICQTHFEREGDNLANIWWMMSKIYADNLARSNSDASNGIARRGVAIKSTERDLSDTKRHNVL